MDKVMTNGFSELSYNDMYEIDGGVWWEACVAAWVCYEVGYAIGKAIAHATSK